MKRIGLVDYFLDEYHAHEAFNSIKRYNEEHGTDWQIYAAYGEIDNAGGITNGEFCAQHGIKRALDIAELVSAVDEMAKAIDYKKHSSIYAPLLLACAHVMCMEKAACKD